MPQEKYWTRERILSRIHEWNEKHQRAPYSSEWFTSEQKDRDGRAHWPSATIVQREFGSWIKAIHEAGLRPPPRRPKGHAKQQRLAVPMGYWTKEKAIARVHEWVAEHHYPPAVNDWRGMSPKYPDVSTVFSLFGDWNTMIKEAGYIPRPRGVNRRAISQYRPLLGNRPPENANAPTGAGADREEP